MKKETKTPQILISDRRGGLPYSKGLLASQVMVTGLSPFRAYQVAEAVEEALLETGSSSVSTEELERVALDAIERIAGDRYAKNFRHWQDAQALDVPIVVLIGGATGVGKSTIATQLATRLGIVRVVATDAIREVMRALFSKELMPALYASSFEAGKMLREPPSREAAIVGFREQTNAVAVGIDALLQRAALEGTSIIIEGAHVVPGFVDLASRQDRFLAVPVVIAVEEEEVHRGHLRARGGDHAGRPATRYLEGFDDIRRIQRYIKTQALSHGVPVIPNYTFDRSLTAVIDLVLERATERASLARGDGGNGASDREGGTT
jgi:2-phosphoglycerate kinase